MIIFLLSLLNAVATIYFVGQKSFIIPMLCCISLIARLIVKAVFYDEYKIRNRNRIYSFIIVCFFPILGAVIAVPLKIPYIQEIGYVLAAILIVVTSFLRVITLIFNKKKPLYWCLKNLVGGFIFLPQKLNPEYQVKQII